MIFLCDMDRPACSAVGQPQQGHNMTGAGFVDGGVRAREVNKTWIIGDYLALDGRGLKGELRQFNLSILSAEAFGQRGSRHGGQIIALHRRRIFRR